jgi:hypothetical protein
MYGRIARVVVVIVLSAAPVLGALESVRPDPVRVVGGQREQPLERAIAAIRPDEIATVLPRDGIPAIVDPPMAPAERVGDELEPDDLVIGVALGGEARAYPIRILSAHEIVDDRVRDTPIAVTW